MLNRFIVSDVVVSCSKWHFENLKWSGFSKELSYFIKTVSYVGTVQAKTGT